MLVKHYSINKENDGNNVSYTPLRGPGGWVTPLPSNIRLGCKSPKSVAAKVKKFYWLGQRREKQISLLEIAKNQIFVN